MAAQPLASKNAQAEQPKLGGSNGEFGGEAGPLCLANRRQQMDQPMG